MQKIALFAPLSFLLKVQFVRQLIIGFSRIRFLNFSDIRLYPPSSASPFSLYLEPLPSFVLFDMRTKHEYEANALATHLIIDDDELIDLMKQDYDVVQLSAAMVLNYHLRIQLEQQKGKMK